MTTLTISPPEGNPLYDTFVQLDAELDLFEMTRQRWQYCLDYSWAVPSPQALDELVAFTDGTPVHEVAAGRGYWASQLSARGVEVVASDAHAPADNDYCNAADGTLFHPVGLRDAVEAAADAGCAGATLLLIWPPMTAMAADVFDAFVGAGGTRLVYVGEWRHGCTASDGFFDRLDRCDVVDVDIRCWSGFHDEMSLVTVR